MGRAAKTFLIVTAAIPLLGLLKRPPEFTLLIYTVFAVALLKRKKIKALSADLRFKPWPKLGASMVAAGLLAEVLAWGGHYLARSQEPALLHPQLIPDLILALGFYSGWAWAWLVSSRWWSYSLAEAFVTAGVFGVCFEESGVILRRVAFTFLLNPATAVLTGLFVFAVYGSIVGLGFLPVVGKIPDPEKKRARWVKYPAAFALMFVLMKVGMYAAGFIGLLLHLIPERQPIGSHPFF